MKSKRTSPVTLLSATALMVAIWIGRPANAQVVYPFDLPADISATLHVDTTRKTSVNHMLLGLNCNWPEDLYSKVGYNHPDAQRLIKRLPIIFNSTRVTS